MKSRFAWIVAFGLVAAGLTGAAVKEVKPTTSQLAKTAAQGGKAEVELGNLALERAQDQDLRSFARQMVADRSKAGDELHELATKKGWQLPEGTSPKQEQLRLRLANLSGAAFDREYAKAMVEDHDHDVKMFEAYALHGDDADLRAWAAKTLPSLKQHQQDAHSNAEKLGVRFAS